MLAQARKFSPYVALAGVAALIIGAALLLLSGGKLELQNEIPLAVGILLLAIFALLNPGQVREAVTGRTARYGSNALVMSLAFIGILAMLNFLSVRHHKRFDLTQEKQFSLSNQTRQVLKALKRTVKITAFMRGGEQYGQQLEALLKEYTSHTNQIQFEIVDPDLKPSLARQYQIVSYNTIVYESGERRQDSFGVEERDVTASILKVTSEITKTVYFLTGHGERQITDYSESGLSQLSLALEKDNYQVKPLNLAITKTIPADCSVLVIARPTQNLLEDERNRIFVWLLEAGKALIMQDPTYDAGLNDLLAGYLVKYNDDIVIDPTSSLWGDVGVPVVQEYPFNAITKDLPATIFPQARSVEIIEMAPEQIPGFSAQALIASSDNSWGETDLKQPRVRFDEGADLEGPVNIAVTVEMMAPVTPDKTKLKTSTKTRLAVFGDSDVASNQFIGSLGNTDLILNTVNWLAEEEALVAIRPKEPTSRDLILSGNQARLVFYSSTIFLPLVVLAVGIAVWWNRR